MINKFHKQAPNFQELDYTKTCQFCKYQHDNWTGQKGDYGYVCQKYNFIICLAARYLYLCFCDDWEYRFGINNEETE